MGSFWSHGQTFQPPASACGVALFHVPKRPSHPCYPSGKDELSWLGVATGPGGQVGGAWGSPTPSLLQPYSFAAEVHPSPWQPHCLTTD